MQGSALFQRSAGGLSAAWQAVARARSSPGGALTRLCAAEAAGAPAAGGPAAGAPPPPPESQDELLHYCLLAGLRRVPPGDLPCLTSDFYSKYMLPAKPAGRARVAAGLPPVSVVIRRVRAGRLVYV